MALKTWQEENVGEKVRQKSGRNSEALTKTKMKMKRGKTHMKRTKRYQTRLAWCNLGQSEANQKTRTAILKKPRRV